MSINQRECLSIMLIGFEKTGKTSLASRFLFDYFPPANQDYYIDRFHSKILKYRGKNIEVKIVDMHSLVNFFNQNKSSYINYQLFKVDGYIFIYSIDNLESFNQVIYKLRFNRFAKIFLTFWDIVYHQS